MRRTTIFCNTRTGEELRMPVMPGSFAAGSGRAVESLDMAQVGVVNLPGLQDLFAESQEFLLPARPAAYAQDWQEPYSIVHTLERWSLDGDVLRYIIYGTPVNEPVLIEPPRYGERDGTGDVYVTLQIRQYRYLAAEQQVSTGNKPRAEERSMDEEGKYAVQYGDTLWNICERVYGDGMMAYRLATANGIVNPDLILPGQVLDMPNADALKAMEPTWCEHVKLQGAAESIVEKKTAELWSRDDAPYFNNGGIDLPNSMVPKRFYDPFENFGKSDNTGTGGQPVTGGYSGGPWIDERW